MRVSKWQISFLLIILVSLASMPIGANNHQQTTTTRSAFTVSEEITNVPYVWQEVNGFCLPSSLSMVLQSMGLDLSLYDILAASGTGFSVVSISVDESMTLLPGVLVRQIPWLEFLTDLYGLELQIYLNSSTDYGENAMQILASLSSEIIDYANSDLMAPLDVMRDSIDSGYPLTIGVDTYYLPPADWNIIRDYVGPLQPGGIGHAIVIVGYNDTSATVSVFDPGVGLLEPYVGYPNDGRWNYTMPYSMLDNAWKGAGYATFRLSNVTGKADNFEKRLASYISQRLLGNRSSYFEGLENFFYLGTGADAFRGMGLDMNLEAIKDYCTYYLEADKPTAIRLLGHNLEAMMTMQYMAYRSALDSLPDLLPSYDLTEFIDAASEALPHMEVLSHNASMTSVITIVPRNTLLYNTFFDMASTFESSHDLDGSIAEHSEELDEIAAHLISIADAWKTAGQALASEIAESEPLPFNNLIVVIGGGAVVLIIAIVFATRRRNAVKEC
ncbi:MAG: C39 family peptidase [Candidatus Thorarchaeota archaeon]